MSVAPTSRGCTRGRSHAGPRAREAHAEVTRAPRVVAAHAPQIAETLALQRSAGNRAVASLLQSVEKKRKTPGATPPEFRNESLVKVVPPVTWTGVRPKEVTADVRPVPVPTRDATATPLAYFQRPGAGEVQKNAMLGYDGGHVIGLHLDGDNIGDNVVPMLHGFNRGPWKNMEDVTKAFIETHPGRYRMKVTMAYTSAVTPEVPTTFTVTREVYSPLTLSWSPAFGSLTLSQPADIPTTARLKPEDERKVNPLLGDVVAPVTLDPGVDWFITDGLSLKDYVNTKGHMPPSKKALYPDAPAKRPYEFLDILSLNGAVMLPLPKGPFADFGADRRALILQTNMARHAGKLVSDDPTDPQQDLDERGAANAPEIDHIVPKSLGGSDFFSNARVISWQLNNKEARVKPLAGLVDLTRLAVPMLPKKLPDQARILVEQAVARRVSADFSALEIVQWANERYNGLRIDRLPSLVTGELEELLTQGVLTKAGDRYSPV